MDVHEATNPEDITVEELVWQDDFRAWVLNATPALDDQWAIWQRQHPQQAETIRQAREIVVALRVKNQPITHADIQEVIAITRQHVERPAPVVIRYSGTRIWQAAASVLVILTLGAGALSIYYKQLTKRPSLSSTFRKATPLIRTQKADQPLQLPDGSTVRLGQTSELTYPRQFAADRREVHLTGTATFDVKRQPDQPFLVYANGSVTRVLGTRFTVQTSRQSTQVLVKVLSGKVSVLAEEEWQRAMRQTGYQPQTIIVTPNQQVVFDRTSKLMHKGLVSKPVPITVDEELVTFNFVNAPVTTVLTTLEKAYGIPINFDRETFRDCRITAPLTDESLFEKLTIICETIGARYEVVEAQIMLTGKGCSL